MISSAQMTLFAPPRPDASEKKQHRAMKVAGLFAGIGGFEHGLHKAGAGHETVLLCEVLETAQAVLRDKFPEVPIVGDVRELEELPPDVDLLTAGFPCQDLSQAGKTRGIGGDKSGLIVEVFRLLRRRRVQWVLLENVPFMLQLSKGRALEVILDELEDLGYRWAYRVVDSRAFGLPQRRRRVFLLASLEDDPRDVLLVDDAGAPEPVEKDDWEGRACGFYWTEGIRGLGWAIDAVPTLKGGSGLGIPSPPAIVLPNGRIVKPSLRDAERMQGFDPDWTKAAEGPGRRNQRWLLVGNAVSVNTAEWLGRRLAQPGAYDPSDDELLVRTGSWPVAAWNVDGERWQADVSEWPERRPRLPLADFLSEEGTPLSERATAGFRGRTKRAKLRFPEGFLDRVDDHLEWVRSQ